MQDVRMSPILSLRNRQNFNFENEEPTPSFRMQTSVPRAGYPIRGGHTQLLRRKTPQNTQKRKRVLSSLKRKAKEIRQKIPTVTDVNKIDKYSRLVFPLLFIVFNACYWCFYLLQWYAITDWLSKLFNVSADWFISKQWSVTFSGWLVNRCYLAIDWLIVDDLEILLLMHKLDCECNDLLNHGDRGQH